MRFLGGLLKFLGILVLLGATAVCAIVAVIAADTEAYFVMGLCWVCAVFVSINILGTGMALSRLAKTRKKVQELEQKLMNQEQKLIQLDYKMRTAPVAEAASVEKAETPVSEEPVQTPVGPVTPAELLLRPHRKRQPRRLSIPPILPLCLPPRLRKRRTGFPLSLLWCWWLLLWQRWFIMAAARPRLSILRSLLLLRNLPLLRNPHRLLLLQQRKCLPLSRQCRFLVLSAFPACSSSFPNGSILHP